MASNPFEIGSPVIKSIDTICKDALGIGINISDPFLR